MTSTTKKRETKQKQDIKKNYYVTGFSLEDGDVITISEKSIGNATFGKFKPSGEFKLLKIIDNLKEAIKYVEDSFNPCHNADEHIFVLGESAVKYKIIKLFDLN